MPKDPRDEIVAGPVEHDWGNPQIRIDSDDKKRTITLYVLKPGTNQAISQLRFDYENARALAHFILETTD